MGYRIYRDNPVPMEDFTRRNDACAQPSPDGDYTCSRPPYHDGTHDVGVASNGGQAIASWDPF